jgi:hypothetical protein
MGMVVPMIIHCRTPLPTLQQRASGPGVSARRQKPRAKRDDRDGAGDLQTAANLSTHAIGARHENHEPVMQQHGFEAIAQEADEQESNCNHPAIMF